LAHKLAVHHPLITADCVEVGEFPEMIQKYNISGVPKIVINDFIEFVGAQPADVFLDAVKRAGM
jgi:predicted DsbA family dithiol-disulfide isomerase